jgi:hypothetical protein
MGKLRAIGKHPFTGGFGAIVTALGEGLSWAGILPVSASPVDQLWWLRVWFLATVGFAAWGYIAWLFRWRALTEPKAKIVFDSRETSHVQHGVLGAEPDLHDEYIYALGIINLSARPLENCRLVLASSTPQNTSEQRLDKALRVRDDDPTRGGQGKFTIYPGKSPSAYIEILQEMVPQRGGMGVHSSIKLRYANEYESHANPFTDRNGYVLAFRLDGSAEPIFFRLRVTYDAKRRRWSAEPMAIQTSSSP